MFNRNIYTQKYKNDVCAHSIYEKKIHSHSLTHRRRRRQLKQQQQHRTHDKRGERKNNNKKREEKKEQGCFWGVFHHI